MDIEFHYYITYLIAARAGFTPADAAVIAQSAQEIDDNHIPIIVSAGTAQEYKGTVSQTTDILHPRHNERIYPIFHFIPGDSDSPTAIRKDGIHSAWVTTPNSPLANDMLDTALRSKDLYRIGASTHAYADTWAHQNFLGKDDSFNEMPDEDIEEKFEATVALMRVGHALAGHKPDIPGLIWTDGRLAQPIVENTPRFMDAAELIFRRFYQHLHSAADQAFFEKEVQSLRNDLSADIGPSSENSNQLDQARTARYKQRSLNPSYGGQEMPIYAEGKWADAAFVEQRADLKVKFAIYMAEHSDMAGDILDFRTRMPCAWQDPLHYQETDWYKFQEAVKSHLDECWSLLTQRLPEIGKADGR